VRRLGRAGHVAVGSGWDLFDFDRPRRERIIAQCGPEAAAWIIARALWRGATQAMVGEMFGSPVDGSKRVTKSKTIETWRWFPLGGKHYGLTVTFEDGICVAWQERRS
jgi:hypothetical protein